MNDVAGNLKRRLGLGLLTLYGLGSIVGAGICVLVGEVAGKAGLFAVAFCRRCSYLPVFAGIRTSVRHVMS